MKRSGLHDYITLMKGWENRTFLVGYRGYRKQVWTFGNVQRAVYALSKVLADREINKGDNVVLVGRACPEWVVAFFAVLHRGAVVVPLDPSTTHEQLLRIIEKTEAGLIIGDQISEEGDQISDETAPAHIPFSTVECLRLVVEVEPPVSPAADIQPGDTAEIVFTSGTTSEPKGVVLTHGNILSNLNPIDTGLERKQKLVRLLTPFRLLCTVPYSHMFGQAAGIFLPILLGSTVYYSQETGPASLIRAIKRDRILTLIAVPRVLKLLTAHIKSDLQARGKTAGFERRWNRWVKLPYALRALFFLDIHRMLGLHFWSFIVGGAPLDFDTHEFWRRLVFSVFLGYGLTETAPMVTMFNPFRHDRSSVGKVMPGQEVKIGADGEILIRGANVMSGYYKDPRTTEAVMEDGWFKTGDIGTIDEEGHIFIKGRKKDMILTQDGLNVYPEDIEKVLNSTSGVREGVVLGVPREGREYIHAALLLDAGADVSRCIQQANSKLMPHQRIHEYTVWHETDFPRTSTLKVRKGEVLKKILQSGGKDTASISPLDGLVKGSASPDLKLGNDLGMDSLDLVEAVSIIEKKYNVSIDESMIGKDTTVGELQRLASQPTATRTVPMPRWTRRKVVSFFRRIVTDTFILLPFSFYCKITASGLENLKELYEPVILSPNHTSHLDPLALLLALPTNMRWKIAPAMGLNRFHKYFSGFGHVSREEYDTPKKDQRRPSKLQSHIDRILYGFAYHLITFLFQTYPFPQGAAYRASLEYTGELLDAGHWILIFPEGEVSRTGTMNPFRGGISVIAERTHTRLLPVGITGMREVLPPGKRWPRRGRVEVRFGKPVGYDEAAHEPLTTILENEVRKLAHQDRR
jgi:long-chain acyl-CoA synthetase